MSKQSLFDDPVLSDRQASSLSSKGGCGCRHTLRQAMVPARDAAASSPEPCVPPQNDCYVSCPCSDGCPTIPASQPGDLAPEETLQPSALYEYVDNDYGEIAASWYEEAVVSQLDTVEAEALNLQRSAGVKSGSSTQADAVDAEPIPPAAAVQAAAEAVSPLKAAETAAEDPPAEMEPADVNTMASPIPDNKVAAAPSVPFDGISPAAEKEPDVPVESSPAAVSSPIQEPAPAAASAPPAYEAPPLPAKSRFVASSGMGQMPYSRPSGLREPITPAKPIRETWRMG